MKLQTTKQVNQQREKLNSILGDTEFYPSMTLCNVSKTSVEVFELIKLQTDTRFGLFIVYVDADKGEFYLSDDFDTQKQTIGYMPLLIKIAEMAASDDCSALRFNTCCRLITALTKINTHFSTR